MFGEENISYEKVKLFYSEWYSFESWRDIYMEDENNLDQAENRYEKRYMEKENKALKKEWKKNESKRIRKLVEQAYSLDPRVKKYKEEE